MTADDPQDLLRLAAEMLDGHPEDGGGIRPAVVFADHSYPAFSRKQMIDFAVAFARAHFTKDTSNG